MKKLLVGMVLWLAGCAAVGLSDTPSFNEGMAVGLTTVTTVRNTATVLLKARKLTAEDGDNVLKTTDTARAGLDVARRLAATDLKSAQGKLEAVRAVLAAQQAYLALKEK